MQERKTLMALRSNSEWLAVFFLSFLAVVVLQHMSNAYTKEFGLDAASHYVSGAMFHDFATSLFAKPPLEYVRDFHSHYPLVGVGHWPPVYYGIEALWMLAAGSTRASVLLLSAVVTASASAFIYNDVYRREGRVIAALLALVWVVSPIVQVESADLMLDVPVALACYLAMRAYDRYLQAPTIRTACRFGVIASLAILTKGNAFCLVLLPAFSILLSGRFSLLKTISFWLPIGIVGLFVGVWTAATYNMVAVGFRYAWGIDYTSTAIRFNAGTLWVSAGAGICIAAAAGLTRVLAFRAADRTGSYIAPAALLLSVFFFQACVPAALQARYMLPALLPLLVLAGSGLGWIATRLESRNISVWRRQNYVRPLLVAAAGAAFLPLIRDVVIAPELGLIAPIRIFHAMHSPANPVLLIIAGAEAEAPAIAELATLDAQRPGMFGIRGSRLLGGGAYNNHEYSPKFNSASEVMNEIDRYKVPFVLHRTTQANNEWAHVSQIEQAAQQYSDRWKIITRSKTEGATVTLYRIAGNDSANVDFALLRALSAPRSLAN